MNLEQFIKETLIQLHHGLAAANAELTQGDQSKCGLFSMETTAAGRRSIEFDVAVTVSKEGEGGAGAKARVWVVEAQLGGKGSYANEAVSRVRFKIDIETKLF